MDNTPLPRMLPIIPYKFDIPFVMVGVGYDPGYNRVPYHPSMFPTKYFSCNEKMTFLQRVQSYLFSGLSLFYDPFSFSNAVGIYAPEKPFLPLDDLHARASLWIIEDNLFIDYAKPTMPNVIFTGGLTMAEPKPLPKLFQAYLDDAHEGAVLVSFGSNVRHVPEIYTEKLVRAFIETKYKFIFKSELKGKQHPRILYADWLPQYDILRHPNTKLFITHCGANGQNEALDIGVPMIGFPMFAEQHYNAERAVYKGYGIKMDLLTFEVDELAANIRDVVENSTYRDKIQRASRILHSFGKNPVKEAAWWIDHVVQYGDDHLRAWSQEMPTYQYLGLDVLGVFLLCLHLSVYVLWKTFRFIINILGKKLKKQKRE